ncbi:acyltransferase [Thermoleophilia bacterium SCSIO 60948]|nr:acyltransferase [Thermoleophilia bacterium SCSIO 60948]
MTKRWFRADIEGLRGLAMILVLLAHAGFGFAEGGYVGLDVFFVISGFLITTLILRELDRTGRISLAQFYARRIRRLLPAAAVVLIAIVFGSLILFSPVRNEVVSGDVLASVGYFVNWRLADQSVDYFAQGFEGSPVQHFWSLAVEEQFYILWPLVIVAIAFVVAKLGGRHRTLLGGFILFAGAASLAYSISFTQESPGQAYFSTLTRAWELGLGCLLAVFTLPKLGPRAAGALTVGGVAAIVGSFVTLNESTPFPGALALFPVLGAGAVVVAGVGSVSSLPQRALASRPLCYVGRISYCWYLWHWPALIFAGAIWGSLTPVQGALVIAASWVPAELTHRFVEVPLRHAKAISVRPRRAVGVLVAGSGATAVCALALAVAQPTIPLAPEDGVDGATALASTTEVQDSAEAVRPQVESAFEDRTKLVDDGCFVKLGVVENDECVYGDKDSKTTVVLFGDSHGEQYFPAVERIAERQGWRLVALTKSFCSPAEVEQAHPTKSGRFTECPQWRENTIERILDREKPRMVIVGGSKQIDPLVGGTPADEETGREAMVDGWAETLEELRSGGARVALLTDLPQSPIDIPDCVSENRDDLESCTFPEPDDALEVERRAVERVEGAELVDTVSSVCADRTCRAVIGDAITYRDRGHITATFSATLAPAIGEQLPRLD